jgi:hypothetical protein
MMEGPLHHSLRKMTGAQPFGQDSSIVPYNNYASRDLEEIGIISQISHGHLLEAIPVY